jgi:hypothetical protein
MPEQAHAKVEKVLHTEHIPTGVSPSMAVKKRICPFTNSPQQGFGLRSGEHILADGQLTGIHKAKEGLLVPVQVQRSDDDQVRFLLFCCMESSCAVFRPCQVSHPQRTKEKWQGKSAHTRKSIRILLKSFRSSVTIFQ